MSNTWSLKQVVGMNSLQQPTNATNKPWPYWRWIRFPWKMCIFSHTPNCPPIEKRNYCDYQNSSHNSRSIWVSMSLAKALDSTLNMNRRPTFKTHRLPEIRKEPERGLPFLWVGGAPRIYIFQVPKYDVLCIMCPRFWEFGINISVWNVIISFYEAIHHANLKQCYYGAEWQPLWQFPGNGLLGSVVVPASGVWQD